MAALLHDRSLAGAAFAARPVGPGARSQSSPPGVDGECSSEPAAPNRSWRVGHRRSAPSTISLGEAVQDRTKGVERSLLILLVDGAAPGWDS